MSIEIDAPLVPTCSTTPQPPNSDLDSFRRRARATRASFIILDLFHPLVIDGELEKEAYIRTFHFFVGISVLIDRALGLHPAFRRDRFCIVRSVAMYDNLTKDQSSIKGA